MTLTEIKTAFEGCPASAEAVNRNIRELTVILKHIDRIKFECGYRKDGWYLKMMIDSDFDYQDTVRHLKRLKWLKKAWKGEVGEGIDIEKARMTDIRELYSWEKPQRRPRGGIMCLCPFHKENTPSFNVYKGWHTDIWYFKCFSCGVKGSVIDFVMALHGIGFKEAVGKLNAH